METDLGHFLNFIQEKSWQMGISSLSPLISLKNPHKRLNPWTVRFPPNADEAKLALDLAPFFLFNRPTTPADK